MWDDRWVEVPCNCFQRKGESSDSSLVNMNHDPDDLFLHFANL